MSDTLEFPPIRLSQNALELTLPASDALIKNRKNSWIQLAGHVGAFAPAGPRTIWKKRLAKDNNEVKSYEALMEDVCCSIVPAFFREVEYNGDFFIEIEDLLCHFNKPSIMDVKMGCRTFLESEVKNPILRKDLYEKMVRLDPSNPTLEENEQRAITKLRYMQFRERESSTSNLGFRIEAIKMSDEPPNVDLKKIKEAGQVVLQFKHYLLGNQDTLDKFIRRLKDIREKFASSEFFKHHEIIGSSLLFFHDRDNKVGVWLIDFAKTQSVEDRILDHVTPWEIGNHEDGFLFGLDNLIQILESIHWC